MWLATCITARATYDLVNGVDIYTAEINIPENTSDTEDKIYTLKAKIGDTEQTSVNSTIRVPRKERGLIGINDFTINNQIGDTKISGEQGKNISITMPFDADITSLLPNVELEDMYATYSPATEQDFTSDVVYTVTAEDKVTTKDYTVHVEKQATPQVNSITFEDPEQNSDADLYYVYGKGKLIAILSSPAEAVQLADENVGVVLNSSQSYVWERGNRQQGMRLDETTMPSGFQSASLDENVLKESLGDDYELLNLTGCTREEILYMISSGYGVVVKTGANESLLLTGYDIFGNSWLYNPATGETTALSDDDSDALFAQNGNVFISYIKKVKIE